MTFLLVAAFSAVGAAIPAPVSSVTVYSDRARVTRTAQVNLHGLERVQLPLLLDSVDPTTVVVEAAGAEVRRVDVEHVDAEEFPRVEARELLGKLEKLDDQVARARGDRASVAAVLQALGQLRPQPATEDAMRPVPKLDGAGWPRALEFVDAFSERLHARVRELDEQLTDLHRERVRLCERARELGGAARRSGYRVSPTLAGEGAARVTISYMVASARWMPTYDVQLAADKNSVQVSFAGQVSQESGEDWDDAKLILSTAVPATSLTFPKLYTWKIGEQERFVPTPVATVETYRQPPSAAPLPIAEREDEALRRQLGSYAGTLASGKHGLQITTAPQGATVSVDGKSVDVDHDGIPDEVDDGDKSKNEKIVAETEARLRELDSKTDELKQQVMRTRIRGQLMKETVLGGRAPGVVAAAPPPAPAPSGRPSYAAADMEVSVRAEESYSFGSSSTSTPQPVTVNVGLAPPPGWQAPTYAPNLPVSLAGGYDLTFPSLRNETIKSGGGARRVALLSESWPVGVERRVLPGVAREAFLVAELKNPSSRVLPGGPANLFVGADPAGTASLKVMAPGELATLPLGIDRAIKPIRNVKLDSWEKGVFSKDEISQYTVTIEVANPYRAPMRLRIADQWPVTGDKNVDIKLVRADGAAQDREKGTLTWLLNVPQSGKTVVSFTYTVRRPKGWRLHQ
jgi:hypothetical protein